MTSERLPQKDGLAPQSNTSSDDDLPRIIGIVASAGGLEALCLLAQNLPQFTNAIYVVAQHMSATQQRVAHPDRPQDPATGP